LVDNYFIDFQQNNLQYFINKIFNLSRQIDPFGHSREQASLFAQFGFDSLFLGRIDYQDKIARTIRRSREMLWQASANLPGDTAQLFTGILHNHYSAPRGFNFDGYSNNDPIMDDPSLDGYNVDEFVQSFLESAHKQALAYKTKHIMMPFGDDFLYSNAHVYFKNLDKLIKYVNMRQVNGSKVNVFYSNPSCYGYALNQLNLAWPVKSGADDFFPYADQGHDFWTGYFTSRSALKSFVHHGSTYLQAVRHLTAFADLNDEETFESLGKLERAMGELQHHDAVSGTEKQAVALNYAKHLAIGNIWIFFYGIKNFYNPA
jgi:lysosomal alpha-mannosidase